MLTDLTIPDPDEASADAAALAALAFSNAASFSCS